jgi:hypothetical protein
MTGDRWYTELRITLPTFAVLVLRRRAKEECLTFSEVLESAVLEDIMVDEVQAVAQSSPEAARAVQQWFRETYARRPRQRRRTP